MSYNGLSTRQSKGYPPLLKRYDHVLQALDALDEALHHDPGDLVTGTEGEQPMASVSAQLHQDQFCIQ